MQIKLSKSDIAWNYIGIVISMASNFLILPFLMKYIDGELLGLWYVYLSIGGIVTLFDFGFNPTFARNVAYCWSGTKELNAEGVNKTDKVVPNYRLLKRVISTCKIIYFLISFAALLVLVTVGTGYIYYISKGVLDSTIIISWVIYIIAVFFNLYYGYFATFLRGVGAISEYNKISIIARFFQVVTSIVMLILGYGIIAVAVSYLLYGLMFRGLSKKAFYKYENIGKKLKQDTVKVSLEEIIELFKIIWHNAWKDGFVSLADYCANQASILIASTFLTLTETGIYSISVQLVTAVAAIAAGLYSGYQPAIQSACANNDREKSKCLMSSAMIVYTILFVLGIFALTTIGIPILKIIKPDNVYDIKIILGFALYMFFYKRQSCYTSFISNTNYIPYMKAYVFSSITGVVCSVIIIYFLDLGIWGLIIGQFFVQFAYNFWKWPYEVYKILDTKWLEFIKSGFIFLRKNIKKNL